jgi:hypothetical protein
MEKINSLEEELSEKTRESLSHEGSLTILRREIDSAKNIMIERGREETLFTDNMREKHILFESPAGASFLFSPSQSIISPKSRRSSLGSVNKSFVFPTYVDVAVGDNRPISDVRNYCYCKIIFTSLDPLLCTPYL